MSKDTKKQKVIIVGAGPVGALAAHYAAGRGDDVEVYELREGMLKLQAFRHLEQLGISLFVFSFLFLFCILKRYRSPQHFVLQVA